MAEASWIREEPAPEAGAPLPRMEKAEERRLATDYPDREEELGKDS
jgi:hypothetical protein